MERDYSFLAEYIVSEYEARKKRRAKIKETWDEIDRQVRMEPKPSNIDVKTGRAIEGTEWMPFVEQPLQAQTLEVLTADTQELLFPEERDFFAAHADVDEDFLNDFNPQEVFGGTPNPEIPAVTQDNINEIVEAVHFHYQGLYDYRGMWNRLIIDCYKRGTFAGQYKWVSREQFNHTTRGVTSRTEKFPMLVPMVMDDVYFADDIDVMQYSNTIHGKSPIHVYMRDLGDLQMEAAKGGSDAGWRAEALKNVEPLENGKVRLLSYEGDLIVPRSTTSPIFLANTVFTVVMGRGKGGNDKISTVIRYRENPLDRSSFVTGGYNPEDPRSPYMTSPLVKGASLQKGATEAFNRAMQAAILQTEPPIGFNQNNGVYSAQKGPRIAPRELIPTIGDIQVLQVGNVQELMTAYFDLVRQYQEVTGVNAPRLGAQTKSHQSAFAVGQEVQRGQARTVDYARDLMRGAMETSLEIEWKMIRDNWSGEKRVFVPKWGVFVNLRKKHLPERVMYDVRGAAEPLVERERQQLKIQALQMALQVDQVRKQMNEPGMDLEEFQRYVLQEGGFADVDRFFAEPNARPPGGLSGAIAGEPPVPGAGGLLPQ